MFELDEKLKLNYEVLSDEFIEEFDIEMVTILHKDTKAHLILMICDDKNRVFNIAFRTPVENSKGTPHILEHSVLCGSRKYNVKDPFIELAKSSMNTFLNAMTFPDKTCYPVASANLKDFHNLMNVYLDAVFYPNAIKNDKIFRQEGWHYEIDDVNSSLKVNGVVLNEMKGVYSNPDDILEYSMLKNMYNGTNYAYDYGGVPNEIIDLTFDEFKEFHRKYYSPSNAIIYLYGQLDYNYELMELHDNYLKDFKYIDVDAKFVEAKSITRDNELQSYYSIDTDDVKDKAYLAYSYVIKKKKNALDKIVLNIIDYILFSADSAILRNKFLEQGYGESIYTQNDYGVKEPFYSIIVQNVDEAKADQFKKLLYESFNEILEKGIDVEKLKAAINIIHFQYAEGEYGRMPKGLLLSLNSLDTYLYGEDPAELLLYKKAFEYIESINLSDKENVFYKTIRELFVDNDHRVINILLPKKSYSKEKELLFNETLEKRKSEFDKDSLNDIIKACTELKKYQSEKDDEEVLKCIPTLKVSDLEETGPYMNYVEECDGNIIASYDNDREVVYIDLNFDISDLTKPEIYLFNIIHTVMSKVDLKDMSYIDFDNYVAKNSGGIDVKLNVAEKKVSFSVSVKTFYDKSSTGFAILSKLLKDTIFVDTNRIAMLVSELKANDMISILSSGHMSATTRAESSITHSANILDKILPTGIAKHLFINKFVGIYKDHSDLINDTLSLVYKKVLCKKRLLTASMNKKYRDVVIGEYNKFNSTFEEYIKENNFSDDDDKKLENNLDILKEVIQFDSFEKSVHKEAIVLPTDVNFVAIANAFDKNKYSGKLNLLKTVFNYEYLWTNIRVLGGAYGCMSLFKRQGAYWFTSYRDPNLKNTVDVFNGIYDYLKNVSFSYDTIEKYIIGSIGTFDNPLSVIDTYKKNVAGYFNNITDDMIKNERKELIYFKPDDFKDIAEIFSDISHSSACAIIGDKEADAANEMYDKVWQLTE